MNQFVNASNFKELTVVECGKEECVKSKSIFLSGKDCHLLHYVIYGKGTLLINNKEYVLNKGDMFYIPEYGEATYFPDKDDPWIYEWVGFKGEYSDELISASGLSISHPIIIDKKRGYRRYFDAIVRRYVTCGYLDISSLGALYQLLGEIIYDNEDAKEVSKISVTVQLAKDFIKNNYQFNITIEDIARNANVTPNYLSTIFQKEEGITTKRYLTKIRMETAVNLLENETLKIKDIAELVGYPNQLHFSSEFKKYFGVSPQNYHK